MGGWIVAWSAASTSVSPDTEWSRVRGNVRHPFGRAEGNTASARAAGCVIAALAVIALAVIVATLAVPTFLRVLRVRGSMDGDHARLVIVFAVQGLPPDRADWAQAMLVEFDRVEGRRERWLFSLGCAWASARIRIGSQEPGGALLRAVVLASAAIALALVGYGLVEYPGLRSEPNVWGATVVFIATLLAYTALTVLLSRGEAQPLLQRVLRHSGRTRRWLRVVPRYAPPSALKGWCSFHSSSRSLARRSLPPSRDIAPTIHGRACSRRFGVDLSAA